MKKVINKLISYIKGEKFEFDSNISNSIILSEIIQRLIMLIRGSIKGIRIKKDGIIFCDKGVIFRGKKKIKLGKGTTFKRFVEFNAISKNGIEMGSNASIGAYSIFRCSGGIKHLGKGIKIGNNFGCGDYCFLGAAGGIELGDNVIMGQNVRFHSEKISRSK